MQIVTQSQTPGKVGYIHLAYISAQLGNGISKGELIPGQAYLGIALVTAVVCGVASTRMVGMRRAVKTFTILGFCAALMTLWMVETIWRAHRTDEDALAHIIRTRQYWAMREPKLATGIEAAAETNGLAASLVARYYAMKGDSKNPELAVKMFWFAERAASAGEKTGWVSTRDLESGYYIEPFQAGLKSGKLTSAQAEWAKGKLAQMIKMSDTEQSVKLGTPAADSGALVK